MRSMAVGRTRARRRRATPLLQQPRRSAKIGDLAESTAWIFPSIFKITMTTKEIYFMALLKTGDLAPAFSMRNQHGAVTTLEQYRGHHVVLWWYPKADTPG